MLKITSIIEKAHKNRINRHGMKCGQLPSSHHVIIIIKYPEFNGSPNCRTSYFTLGLYCHKVKTTVSLSLGANGDTYIPVAPGTAGTLTRLIKHASSGLPVMITCFIFHHPLIPATHGLWLMWPYESCLLTMSGSTETLITVVKVGGCISCISWNTTTVRNVVCPCQRGRFNAWKPVQQ